MDKPYVIIIQGGPAVGKTTLAKKLSHDLEIGLLAKDGIKEHLFDTLGAPKDREDSRVYGRATMNGLFAIADTLSRSGKSYIMESAYHAGLAEGDFAKLAQASGARLVQVYCHADRTVQQGRYRARVLSGARHASHLDSADKILNFAKYDTVYTKLDIEPCIDVDTTDFGNEEYDTLLQTIRRLLEA